MRLSEAIRLGIGVVRNEKSLFLSTYGFDGQPGVCGCAIGTGMYAIGYTSVSDVGTHGDGIKSCKLVWPWTCENDIANEISFRHAMGESRESIATWIEQLENERGITDGQVLSPQADSARPIVVSPLEIAA